MADIVEFLTARLNEREQLARAATPGPWRWGDWSSNFGTLERERNTLERAPGYGHFPIVRQRDDESDEVLRLMDSLEIGGDNYPANGEHIAYHDPAHVLADVASKRAIVEDCAKAYENGRKFYGDDEFKYNPHSRLALRTLKQLATPYAEHPDFKLAWSVT